MSTNIVLGSIAGMAGWGGAQAMLANDLSVKTPNSMSAGPAAEQLGQAAMNRIDQLSPGRKVDIDLRTAVPSSFYEALDNPDSYSGSSRRQDGGYRIKMNPNADRAYFAHELGHVISDQTDLGRLVRSARGNPRTKKALMGALLLAPGASAALTPGDDDYATSTALALAASSPVILDEILATKNGLATMKEAGMRATAGQRGRLAGALMTYIGPALLAGAAGNAAGNLLD